MIAYTPISKIMTAMTQIPILIGIKKQHIFFSSGMVRPFLPRLHFYVILDWAIKYLNNNKLYFL